MNNTISESNLAFFRVGVGKIDPITEFDRCHFCDSFVIPKDIMVWKMDSDEIKKEFLKLLGEVPKQGAGNIGKKFVCVDCANDLWDILGLGKYKLELDYD